MPCPPHFSGKDRPCQPPATNCSYAALKPGGVVTALGPVCLQPTRSPLSLMGASSFSANLAASSMISCTVSGVASEPPDFCRDA